MKITLRRIIAVILFCALLACSVGLFGCAEKTRSDGNIKIICTVFPLYDWVRSVVGDTGTVEISLLVSSGADVHSFQPSFADMARIKDSDAVVYVGGQSDRWVEQSVGEDAVSLAVSQFEGVTLYEVSADSLANAHSHEDGEECHEAHDHAFDEHIWLSVRNAAAACEKICSTLCELDAKNADTYRENTRIYTEKLSALDARFKEISEKTDEPLVFADRFPFVYLLEDYAIDYYAAFEGCTAEASADFDTTIGLASKLDSLERKCLFVTESPVEKGLAESVIEQSKSKDAGVFTLDSMQSITASDIENGASYISVMEKNADIIWEIFAKAEE